MPGIGEQPGVELIDELQETLGKMRADVKTHAETIFHRTVEISDNSTFWLELGAVAVVLRFVDEGRSSFGRIRFHIIEASPIMEKFPMSSKLKLPATPGVLVQFRPANRRRLDRPTWRADRSPLNPGRAAAVAGECVGHWPLSMKLKGLSQRDEFFICFLNAPQIKAWQKQPRANIAARGY
jgi:hypothetical protein